MIAHDEEGSVLLLTIGYALLALVLVLVSVDATSLYLAQKRTQSAADAAALAGADGFTLEVVDASHVPNSPTRESESKPPPSSPPDRT